MTLRSLGCLLAVLFLLLSCQEKNQGQDPRLTQPDAFKKVLEAHGDWEKWVEARSFSFSLVDETSFELENHYIDLRNGKARIDADLFQAGNDGEKVWISPNRQSFPWPSVRFYHNLYSTFLSIPYALTDTLVTITPLPNRLFNGISYPTLEAKVKDGKLIGPSNRYELLIDPATGRLAWVLFAENFYDKDNQEQEAIKYEDYREVSGLIFPRLITVYQIENDSSKLIRYQVSYSDIFLVNEELEKSLYVMPKGAEKAD